MKIKKLYADQTGYEILCDEYQGTDIHSLNDIFEALSALKKESGNFSVLATLDDLGQAEYTSMHATMSLDLDDVEGHDLSVVAPEAFEDGEHLGYLSTKSEFFIRERNFLSKTLSVDFSGVCGKGLTLDDDEMDMLESVHHTPLNYIDGDIRIRVVTVQSAALSISAFPNGYFSCDLNPFENYVLAKHLEQSYGYELFGLGASLIGFKRKNPLAADQAESVARDLTCLYNREGDAALFDRFYRITQQFDYLFLKYVESLEF